MIRPMIASRAIHAKSAKENPLMGDKVCRPAILSGLIALLLAVLPAAGAEPVGVVTILDGNVTTIRGLSRFSLAEGVRIMSNDLVETGNGAFARIEFSDGVIVDLGPATRAQLNRPSLRNNDRPALYLLTGWIKISAGKLGEGAKAAVATPQFDAVGLDAESVERIEAGSGSAFAEGGSLRVLDHRGRVRAPVLLRSGDFLALNNGEAPKILGRPTPQFLANLPREFQDRLPARIARFKEREVPAKSLGTFTYVEVEPWLDAEPSIRRRFVSEWAAKATDDIAFREALDAGLSRHPEWERLLHPERFEPDPLEPAATTKSAPAGGSSSNKSDSVSRSTVLRHDAPQGARAQ